MAQYTYLAVTQEGKEKKGSIDAKDEDKAKEWLREEGMIPLRVNEANVFNKDIEINIGKAVKPRELSVFCRQFTSILNSGVTVVNALDMLSTQTENKTLKKAIVETKSLVERGETLSNAMRKSPKIFPPLLINMVEAGEVSGSLDTAFERMAVQFEKAAKLKGLVKKAMIYPITLLVISFVVLIVVSVYVIPQFSAMFDELGSDLPAITKLVLSISDFFRYRWYIAAGVLIALIAIYQWIKSNDWGKVFLGKIKIKMPVLGKLNVKSASASFSRTLSTLVSSGVSIGQALEITANSMDNILFQQAVLKTKEDAEQGIAVSIPLKASGVFPDMVSQMVKIGEETGNLEGMLNKVADYYEDEVEIATESLSAALEPVIIIVMAVIVGCIVLAIYMPMIDMYKGMSTI